MLNDLFPFLRFCIWHILKKLDIRITKRRNSEYGESARRLTLSVMIALVALGKLVIDCTSNSEIFKSHLGIT